MTEVTPRIQCDVLIFIATKTEEEQLMKVATELKLEPRPIVKGGRTYYDLGTLGMTNVAATRTAIGAFTKGGSSAAAIFATVETTATALACVGMAFGVDKTKQPPGTVLVSKIVIPYDARDVICGPEGNVIVDYSRAKTHEAKKSLVAILESEAEKPNWTERVQFGALLSGGARIQCSKFRDELRNNLSDRGEIVIGGEMEAIGLLGCCERKKPNWVVVKGVCDYADHLQETTAKEHRELACHTSIAFFLSAIINQPIPK